MSEKNFDFDPNMNAAENQTDNSFKDYFDNKSKSKQSSSDNTENHYNKNQEYMNDQFGKNQDTDYFDDEQKDDSTNAQTEGSKKTNNENENNNHENSTERTDAEREYEQAKNGYEKMKGKGNSREKKAEERMKRAWEDLEKERGEQDEKEEKTGADSEKKESGEKSEKKTASEQKEKSEKNTEELRKEVEGKFKELLEAEGEFKKTKNNQNLFRKTQAWLGIGKTKEGHINNDFEVKKEATEKLKEEYRAKYIEFARKLENEKRQSLKNEGKSEVTIEELIGQWALAGQAISVKEKLKDGKEKENKISLFEYANKKEDELCKFREENLSEKKKSSYRRYQEWRKGLDKKWRFALDCGVTLGVGGALAAGFLGVQGLAVYLGVANVSKVITRKLLIKAGVAAVAGVGVKKILDYDKKKVGEKAEKQRETDFLKEMREKGDIFKSLDEYKKQVQRKDLKNKILLGATGATAVVALGAEFTDAWDSALHEGAVGGGGKIAADPNPEDVPDGNKGGDLSDKDKMIADKVNEDKNYKAGSRADAEGRRAMYKNLEDLPNQNEQLLNHNFELAKGGNVWNSLSEHFNGDRQEVAKVLAGFRAETMDDLMKNHGMSEVRANQFIEWRYRHMDVGAGFELKDGKLDISGFDSEQKIAQFGKTEFNNPDNINDTMENTGESRSEREIFKPSPREDFFEKSSTPPPSRDFVDILEPVEPVKILDPEISAQIDQNVSNLVKDIYGRQSYEWDVMKNKNALDIINEDYGNPIKATFGENPGERVGVEVNEVIESERGNIADNGLDQAEINNRKELRNVLLNLTEKTGIPPEPNETVEQFIRRVEMNYYTQGVAENLSEKATVEVPDPDSFEQPAEAGLKNDLAGAPDRLVGWDNLKNNSSWEVLDTGDELTRNHLKDLIVSSNSVPVEGESLEEFHNRALEKINGNVRIPQTNLEESLSKVFGEWDRNKIDQWLKMRDYKAEVIYDRDIFNLNLTDEEHMAFSRMKAHLQELARASGMEPAPGESLAQYIEKAQKSLKI